MVEKSKFNEDEVTVVVYEGKRYRMLKYGSLATYIIANVLGETIAKLFTAVRTGFLACKLWFDQVVVEIADSQKVNGKTHEMLFANRTEVGCFFTWPDTLCIVGPLGPENSTGYLYQAGDPCSQCKYGCSGSLCNPSPDYFFAMREKYKKHLRPKIEKFEVVEGLDGKEPPIGYNFMLDSAGHSIFLMSIIILSSSLFFQ